MNLRVLVSLNWTLGIVFFAVALAWPFIQEKMIVPAQRSTIEQAVELIVREEMGHYTTAHDILHFDYGDMPTTLRDQAGISSHSGTNDFEYSAFVDDKGILVIKARPRKDLVQSGAISAETYTVRIKNIDTQERGECGWGIKLN